MSKIYKVVIIGFAHMHINLVAAHFYKNPKTELVACADTEHYVEELEVAPYTRKWNMEFAKENFGISKIYDFYVEMLEEEKPDLAIITSENIMHAEIVENCAKRGVAVCVEKPMAKSLSEGLKMVRSCQAYGTELIINWPVTWLPELHLIKKLLNQNKIGRIIEFKSRISHTGPLGPGAKHEGVRETANSITDVEKARTWWHKSEMGGGAMLDFCCYGSMLSRLFINKSGIAVIGMWGNFNSQWGDAEDNAVMIVRYPDAFAVIEGSWTTYNQCEPSGPIIYGTDGTMLSVKVDEKMMVKVIYPSGEIEMIEPTDLPNNLKDIASAYVHHMDMGEPLHETLQALINIDGLAVLDAGVRSAKSGKLELVNNWTWQIG